MSFTLDELKTLLAMTEAVNIPGKAARQVAAIQEKIVTEIARLEAADMGGARAA